MPRSESVRSLCVWLFFLLGATVAAAQDPSDAIYDGNTFATFRLTMNPADWSKITDDPAGAGDLWQRADMTWQGETVPGVGVKASGQGTTAPRQKQSIRLSFNEFEFANPAGPGTPGRKWRGVNRIKLDSMIGNTDQAMMRDRLAYWTFRQAGAPAPRASHAKLIVNGDYKGVYTVEEPVRKDFVRYRWNEDTGNLYYLFCNTPNGAGDGFAWLGPNPASYVPPVFTAETNFPGGDYTDLVTLCDILNNVPQAQRRTQLDSRILNVDGLLTYMAAFTAVTKNDGLMAGNVAFFYQNNTYFYHRAGTNRIEAVEWDPGASLGLYERDPANGAHSRWDRTIWWCFDQNGLTRWIQGDATASAAYQNKIRQILDGPWASVQGQIDFIYAQIRNDVYSEPYKPFSNAAFDAEKNWLKNWFNQRANYLRSVVGGPPPTSDDAAFVSQTIPSTMTAGQSYAVTVAMRNSGTTTWTSSGGFRLNSRGPYDNTTWGLNRVPLAAGESIAPGQTKTFSFTMIAPAAAGTYLSRWSLANDALGGFGATTPDINVTVTGAPPPTTDDAAFVSQTVPATMTAGQNYPVTVTFQNSGTTTWTSAAGYALTSRGPQGNTTWGLSQVALAAGDSIAPGDSKAFSFTVTAPATPGTYTFRWSMMHGGVAFGPTSADVLVTVNAAPPPSSNGAQFVSQTVPSTMIAGQVYGVTVTMRNSGTTTWADPPYSLRHIPAPPNNPWGVDRANLAAGESIAPGQSKTFTWNVTAPAAAGTYPFQCQMRESGVEYFGDLTPVVNVVVTTTIPPPTNQPPVVSITSPAAGAIFTAPATIAITADASDPDGTVARVEFFQGGTLLEQSTAAPFSFSWTNVGPGAYTLTARATDNDGDSTTSNPVTITVQAAAGGAILREYWLGLGLGMAVADLTSSPDYPANPSGSEQRTIFEGPVDTSVDGYGARMRGYVIPPASGPYVFVIASNANGELWLSADESPFTKRLIASVPGKTLSREWTKFPEQTSAAILLEAGRRYYIEALQKDDGGSDHLAVGWTLPDGTAEQPIPGTRIAMPFIDLRDNDGDGIVNDDDPDDDNDGIPDAIDPDRDGDGIPNDTEIAVGTDPDDATSAPSAAALAGRDNSNGDGGFLPNDKCSGSTSAAAPPTWALLLVALLFLLALSKGSRQR